jgi:hypothetical protein
MEKLIWETKLNVLTLHWARLTAGGAPDSSQAKESYQEAPSPRLMSSAGFSFSYLRIKGKLFNKKELKGDFCVHINLNQEQLFKSSSLTCLFISSF